MILYGPSFILLAYAKFEQVQSSKLELLHCNFIVWKIERQLKQMQVNLVSNKLKEYSCLFVRQQSILLVSERRPSLVLLQVFGFPFHP